MTEKEREMAAAAVAESPGPEYGGDGGCVIGPSPPARPTDCQLLPPQQHHHQRHQTDNDLQANGPDKPTKPIKTESSSGFLRAARAGNLEKLLEYLKGKMDINTSNANGLNALHLAAKEGHMHVVKELLARGASVDAATKKGNSALHIASLAGQADVVEILVENGAKVNVQSQNGFTPLYMAAQENHSEVVKFLLSSGANQSLSTEDGFTPLAVALQQGHDRVVAVLLENDSRGKVHLPALHIAAKKDDVKATTLLLQNEHNVDTNKNGGLVNDTTKSGFTPLHIACHYGNVNVGRLLIEKGADVNYKARNSITPLHVASKWGRSNMVELLLDAKALIDSRTRDGLTPLHCAARSGHDSVVDLLLERGALVTCKTKNGLTPLHMSSQGDHLDCARLLLYHKAPIDEVTVDYLTPLHVVAHCGNVKTAKLLLDRKCEVNARALNGFTPLHIACKKNRIKIVELLLKYGASLEATTESGLTPLHVSSFMGHMNIVIFLIQHGSNPNHTTMRGETALHLAARANQTDIVRILLRNGAQVDHAKTREQQTALHISSRLGNVDNVLLLLQHGASPDATTKDLYTPLHIAAKEGHDEVVEVLLEHGAKQALTTKRGFTPLHVASKYGNLKVVQSLIQRKTNPNFEGKNGLTPLHVATHYNRVNVALYLLEKNASPHCATKNGYTSLHIAAKKNQMDIATTLLEHGSNVDAESRNGFTPLHLASQEGHTDMVALLSERGADANCAAKNGLTPLHLTAQEDHVSVAQVLVGHNAKIDPQTKAGYTPLHTACHFGQVSMIRFLLEHDAAVNSTTKLGYTPLHQAAQQGHVLVNSLLLKYGASPNVVTNTGQTPLSIAQRLGYISVVEILKNVTNVSVSPSVMEEKYKVTFPETMQEAPISDSEEEGGEESLLIDQSFHYLTSSEKPSDDIGITKENKDDFIFERASDRGSTSSSGIFIDERKSFKESGIVPSDFKGIKDDAMIMSFSECSQSSVKMETMQSEMVPYQYSSQEIPSSKVNQFDEGDYHQYTSSFSGVSNAQSYETSVDFSSEHSTPYSGFLVSFMVDARGGAMRGCRHSGVRVIVPPGRACMPTRVTCRLVKREKVVHPPALMEGEALASRILEMGPVGTKFSGPVIIEIPHFASLRGKEREITVLRSENGQTWREHSVVTTEEAVQEALQGTFFPDLESADDLLHKRIIRILTTDIPQYFAIVARVRQETSTIGPDGGMICSTVTPRVQALFPEGSLTKNIKVGLQVLPVPSETVSKLLGNRVAVSPIVTVEPRRRKFHRPITLTIPAPTAAQKGMLNQYGGETPTLRLLCSIMGGTSPAQWEDITGTTPLTFVNDCVSFTTTVSARFWLMDCQNVNESAKMASDLYHDIILVPFMSRFVVFAKRHDPMEARLHVFCMTDDKMDKHLENREHFRQVARSSDVEVLEAKPQYVEMGGNLVPVTKSGEKPSVGFRAFRENRLAFTARVRDVSHDAAGLLAFMREPKISRSEVMQVPICTLTITLPDYEPTESPAELEELKMQYRSIKKRPAEDQISKAELWLTDIADSLGPDWIKLAHRMEIDNSDISKIEEQYTDDSEKALLVLHLWIQKFGERATGNELERALHSIGREDIVQKCLYNIEEVTDAVEKVVAKVYLDSGGFDALRDDLGSSVESSIPLGAVSLDASYEEQDIIKESESLADESITLEGNNIELTSLEDGETAPAWDSFDEQNVKEVTVKKTEDLSFNDINVHLSHFEMHQFSGEDSKGIVDISDPGFQSSINELEETMRKEEAKQTFAADILESSFEDASRGQDESSKIIVTSARTNIPAQYVQSREGRGHEGTVEVSDKVSETFISEDDILAPRNLESGDQKSLEAAGETEAKDPNESSIPPREEEMKFLPQIIDISVDDGSQDNDIGDQRHSEKQDKVASAFPSCLTMMPLIHIQGASPMILSPTDEQTFTSAYDGDHGGIVDLEKVVEQAGIKLERETEDLSSVVSEGVFENKDGAKANFSTICIEEHLDQDQNQELVALDLCGSKETYPLEDRDDGVGISFEEDVGNVPLSPTDYSLLEESEVFSFDALQTKKDLSNDDEISINTSDTQYLNNERLPSPSEYTLLTESVEGSDFNGAVEATMMPDEVYSIPEPFADVSNEFSVTDFFIEPTDEVPDSEPNFPAIACPSTGGTTAPIGDVDQGFCGEEFEIEEALSDRQLDNRNLDGTLLNFPLHTPQQAEALEKESVCIEEKDVDEKECEEVDLERPEKGDVDAEKEFFGDKLETDDLDVELIFQLDGDELEDGRLLDVCQPPRVPFQTPVKNSPIDILLEFGQNSPNQSGSSIFLMQPEILERKLSGFNLGLLSPTANEEENLDERLQLDGRLSGEQDEFGFELSGDALCHTADVDRASSCSSNSEVARLEEIGAHLQEPARQLKADEKSEETDVDDAFSPCARDASDFDFAPTLSLSATVQSPVENISPTVERALKEEISPVTVLSERLQINVGVSPSEFIAEDMGVASDYDQLGQNSKPQWLVSDDFFRPIVDSGESDDLEIAFAGSVKAEEIIQENSERAESDEEGISMDDGERGELKEMYLFGAGIREESKEMDKSEIEVVKKKTERSSEDEESSKKMEMLDFVGQMETGTDFLSSEEKFNIKLSISQDGEQVDMHNELGKEIKEHEYCQSENLEPDNSHKEPLQTIETHTTEQLNEVGSVIESLVSISCDNHENMALAFSDNESITMNLGEAMKTEVFASSASLLEPADTCNVFVDMDQVIDSPSTLEPTKASISEPHENIKEVYETELLQTILEHRTKETIKEDLQSCFMSFAAHSSDERKKETEHFEMFSEEPMTEDFERCDAGSGSSALPWYDPVRDMRLRGKISASVDEGKTTMEAALSFHRLSMDPAVLEGFLINQESVDRTESPSFDSDDDIAQSLTDEQEIEKDEHQECKTRAPELDEFMTAMNEDSRKESLRGTYLEEMENFDKKIEIPKTEFNVYPGMEATLVTQMMEKESVKDMEMTSPKQIFEAKEKLAEEVEEETSHHFTDCMLENVEMQNEALMDTLLDLTTPEKEICVTMAHETDTAVIQDFNVEMLKNFRCISAADELEVKVVDESTGITTIGNDNLTELKEDSDSVEKTEELTNEIVENYGASFDRAEGNNEHLEAKYEGEMPLNSTELKQVVTEKLSLQSEASDVDAALVAEDEAEVKITTEFVSKELSAHNTLHPSDCSNLDQKSFLSRDVPSISSEDVPKTSTSSDASAEPTILAATYDLDLGAVSRVVATYDISPDSVEKVVTLEMQTKAILSSPDDEVFESELVNGKSSMSDCSEVEPNANICHDNAFGSVFEAEGGLGDGAAVGTFELVEFDDVAGYEEYLEILKQNQSFMDGTVTGPTASCNKGDSQEASESSISAVYGSYRETEDESDEDTLNELSHPGTFHEAFTRKVTDYSGSGEVDCVPEFDFPKSSQSHLPVSFQQLVEIDSSGIEDHSANVFSEATNKIYETFSSLASEHFTDASAPAPCCIQSNEVEIGDLTPIKVQSCSKEESQFSADEPLYLLQSDANSESATGREERHKTYAGKSALYSEATYQMFSTTEDTPDDYDDEEDDEVEEDRYYYHEEDRTSASEIQGEELPETDNYKALNFEAVASDRDVFDELNPVEKTCRFSEGTEPELLALNDEDNEALYLNETSYSTHVAECQDHLKDSSELPLFLSFHLAPGHLEVDRPLSPVPDDSRRILEQKESSSGESDEEVVDDGSRFFEHIEHSRPCYSDEFSDSVDDQVGFMNKFNSEIPDQEINLDNVDLNAQAEEFVNLVLQEAKLEVSNDCHYAYDDDDTLVEQTPPYGCEDDVGNYFNDVKCDDITDAGSVDCEFSIRMKSCVESFFNEQNRETAQSSSYQSYTETTKDEDGKVVSKSLTLANENTTHLEDDRTIENAEMISSFHSDTYSVDEDGKVIVRSKDIEETSTKTRMNEDKQAEKFTTQNAELSKRYFDENDSLVTETAANQRLQHSLGSVHREKCKETDSCSEDDRILRQDPLTCKSEVELLHTENRADHFETCGDDQSFDETRETIQTFARTEEQKMNFSESQNDGLQKKGDLMYFPRFNAATFQTDISTIELSSSEPLSPENEGDSSSIDSFATVVPYQPDDRLSELSSSSSSFHSDVHAPFQEDPYVSTDARDDEEQQEGSTEQDDSSSNSDRFEVLERAHLDLGVIEVLPGLDSPPDELKYGDTNAGKDEFESSAVLTLATIREEEEKASLSGKSEKTSGSSDKVEITSECSDRMVISPELLVDSPGLSAGTRFFGGGGKCVDKDNISVSSSLLEFERLEKEMQDKTSLDSLGVLSGESHAGGKSSDNDDVSISSSLAEFERLEGELTQSDSFERISVGKLIGSTTSLNAFPMMDIGKPKHPQEMNLFEEQFQAEADKVASLLDFGALPLIEGLMDKTDVQQFNETPTSETESVLSSQPLASAISSYPQYQDIVQIIREASEDFENFEFGSKIEDSTNGQGVDALEERSSCVSCEDESDSEAVVTVMTNRLSKSEEKNQMEEYGNDDDDDESESPSHSGTLDSELHTGQMSAMHASMDSFEFDSCPVRPAAEPVDLSEAAQLGRLLRSEIDAFSDIGGVTAMAYYEDGAPHVLQESSGGSVPAAEYPTTEINTKADKENLVEASGRDDGGEENILTSDWQPSCSGKPMEQSSESGAWSQSDSLISTETVKSSDSAHDIMLVSLDSPESNRDMALKQEIFQETKGAETSRQQLITDAQKEHDVGQKDEGKAAEGCWHASSSVAAAAAAPVSHSSSPFSQCQIYPEDPLFSVPLPAYSEDILKPDQSVFSSFSEESACCADVLMFNTHNLTTAGDGSQQTALVPSNQELSRADDEQVSRVILRKQIHKKTIVQGGNEETIITEDTQIQQDDNAPQELKDSVQELISQFLDANGDQGSTDDLAE